MKILFIRFSSIGDIVLTTPILRCFKKKYPDASLHYLVKDNFKKVIEFNPNVDVLQVFKDDLKATISSLKEEKYDFIIDLQKNIRSKRIVRQLDIPAFSFPKLNILKWILVNFKWDLLPDKSIVDRYFLAVKKFKVKNDGEGLEFFIPDEFKTKLDDIPLGHYAGFVACVIGGSFFTKRYPVEKWQEFCRLSKYPIVLLGGPEDRERGEEIVQANPGKVYNACGKFNLLESADLVRRSRVVVTNDTGLMHIAAAFQKPIISLWGNTTPEMGMFPYFGHNNLKQYPSPKSLILEINNLSCRPCSKIGFDKCPKGHFKCMQNIDVQLIAQGVRQFWNIKD